MYKRESIDFLLFHTQNVIKETYSYIDVCIKKF